MGTNYYHHTDPCPTCGHYEIRHIGKSSVGWMFLFRGYKDDSIESHDDWMGVLESGGTIVDEYDRKVPLDDLKDLIEAKRSNKIHTVVRQDETTWTDEFGHPFNGHDFC